MDEVEEHDGPFEFTRDNLVALATAAAAGHTKLIRFLLRWHGLNEKVIDMELFIALCREKGVKQENINQELTQTICRLMAARRGGGVKKKHIQRFCLWALSKIFF